MSKPPKRNNFSQKGARAKGKKPAGSQEGFRHEEGLRGQKTDPRRGAYPSQGRAAPSKAKSAVKADLFGLHAVREAWHNPKRYIHALFITETAFNEVGAALETELKRPAPTIVTKEDLDRAFPPGTVHQGIALSAQKLDETGLRDILIKAEGKECSVMVVLDQVTDPHNVGAILRSASAFGADGVVMQSKHAPDLTGILAKTACGAVEHIDVAYETNLSRALETLKDHGYTAIGLDEHSEKTFDTLPFYDRTVIVLGAEGTGMRRLVKEHCDVLVTLPTRPPIASLNVSNAAAVALYALSAKSL